MLDRLESYARLFQAAPLEAQAVIGLAGVCMGAVGGKLAWRLSTPLRWLFSLGLRAVSSGLRRRTAQRMHDPQNPSVLKGRIDALSRGSVTMMERLSRLEARFLEPLDPVARECDPEELAGLREWVQHLEDRLNIAEKARLAPVNLEEVQPAEEVGDSRAVDIPRIEWHIRSHMRALRCSPTAQDEKAIFELSRQFRGTEDQLPAYANAAARRVIDGRNAESLARGWRGEA